MRFKDFLLEGDYKKNISVEEAENLLNAHCKDAVAHFDKPLWRGFSGTKDAYLLHGELGGRVSANTSNHYTVIMDHFLPPLGYPARSKSIILANNPNRSSASGFGHVYAIFPYDGVKIGVCSGEDLWFTRFAIGGSTSTKKIDGWNDFFQRADIPDYSYEDLVQGIKDTLENEEDDHNRAMENIFGYPKEVERILKEAYSPESLQLHLATTKNIHEYDNKGRELWIGGKCVALDTPIWKQLAKNFGHDVEDDD